VCRVFQKVKTRLRELRFRKTEIIARIRMGKIKIRKIIIKRTRKIITIITFIIIIIRKRKIRISKIIINTKIKIRIRNITINRKRKIRVS